MAVLSLRRDEGLRLLIQQRLAATPVQAAAATGLRRAAVALVLVDAGFGADLPGFSAHTAWSDDCAFLLTRRATTLKSHAGQWALPGGRIDAGETAQAAALRELGEELGLQLPDHSVLGRLDDYSTRSGYVITPFVVWAESGPEPTLTPDPAEVASAHRIPLTELLRTDAPLLDPPHEGHHQPVLRMPLGQHWVAAPTAAVLHQFSEWCLHGRPTRVAHFDQPRFTWR